MINHKIIFFALAYTTLTTFYSNSSRQKNELDPQNKHATMIMQRAWRKPSPTPDAPNPNSPIKPNIWQTAEQEPCIMGRIKLAKENSYKKIAEITNLMSLQEIENSLEDSNELSNIKDMLIAQQVCITEAKNSHTKRAIQDPISITLKRFIFPEGAQYTHAKDAQSIKRNEAINNHGSSNDINPGIEKYPERPSHIPGQYSSDGKVITIDDDNDEIDFYD